MKYSIKTTSEMFEFFPVLSCCLVEFKFSSFFFSQKFLKSYEEEEDEEEDYSR